jgi:hypothetical protein
VKNRAIFHKMGIHSFLVDVLKAGEDDPTYMMISGRALHRLCADGSFDFFFSARPFMMLRCIDTNTMLPGV